MKNRRKNEKPKSGFQVKKYFAEHKIAIAFFILVNVLAGACSVGLTILVADMVQKITDSSIQSAVILCLWAILLTIVMRVLWYFSNLIFFKYSRKIMKGMSLDIAKQAFKLDSKTYSDHDSGTFVQRIVSDPEMLTGSFADIVGIALDVITYAVVLVYIAFLNVYLTIAMIALVVIGLTFNHLKAKKLRKNRKIASDARDKITSLTTEIVKSEKDIKSLDLEQTLTELSNEKYNDYHKKSYHTNIVDCNFWTSRNIVLEVGMFLILILGLFLMDAGMIAMATFMLVYSWRETIYDFSWSLGKIGEDIVSIKVSFERINKLFDNDEFVVEKFGNKQVDQVKGEIEFKNVSYTFREWEYKKDEETNKKEKNKNRNKKAETSQKVLISKNQIFNNLSFKIEPNTTVAFVGKSGSGKSTILNLMSKMNEVDEGQVLIDGIDIKDFNKQSLRNAISLVNQFPYIFDMTIKQNLLLAKPSATESEIYDALKKASLKDFVDELKDGINTKVGESGIKLSGGQRQRLAIARVMLRGSSVTIFDESTSALDNFAQGDIKKSIDKMKGKSTIVIVAHRLSTIKNVDKIFFLDKGKIVDAGTFDELFERNEKFQAMFLAENI